MLIQEVLLLCGFDVCGFDVEVLLFCDVDGFLFDVVSSFLDSSFSFT